MEKEQKGETSMGLFLPQVRPENKDLFRAQLIRNDELLPILGNEHLSRLKIYSILWDKMAHTLFEESKNVVNRASQKEIASNFPPAEILDSIELEEKISAFTEILAYIFSKKKTAGIASTSKNSTKGTKSDSILKLIGSSRESLKTLEIYLKNNPKDHNRDEINYMIPDFEKNLGSVLSELDKLYLNYRALSKRDKTLITNSILSFKKLRGDFLSINHKLANLEISKILKDSIELFSSKGYQQYITFTQVEHLLKEDFTSESFFSSLEEEDSAGEYVFVPMKLVRKAKKKKDKEDHLVTKTNEENISRMQKLYPDKI